MCGEFSPSNFLTLLLNRNAWKVPSSSPLIPASKPFLSNSFVRVKPVLSSAGVYMTQACKSDSYIILSNQSIFKNTYKKAYIFGNLIREMQKKNESFTLISTWLIILPVYCF